MTNNTEKTEPQNVKETEQTAVDRNTNRGERKTEYSNQGINKIKDILNSIEKGTKNEKGKSNEYTLTKAIIDSMSENVLENEISKLSDNDLGRLIKKSTKIEGSIEKNKVSDKYKDIVRDAERLRDINDESEEKYGKKIFSTKELIEGIRKGIRGKENNRNNEEV